jgi:lysophospholipase
MELVRDSVVDALAGIETFRVEGPGGKSVRAAFVPAVKKRGRPVRGTVVISPGRTEYIEKHAETARDLVARGFSVLVIDQRGQGWSDRLTANPMAGHLDSYEAAALHLGAVITAAADRIEERRLLLCHSMGGAIGLEGLILGVLPGISAAAFSAPMWGLMLPPWGPLAIRAAEAMGQSEAIAPTVPKLWAPEPFEGNAVTHDPARFARNNALFQMEPHLQIGGATNGWLARSLELFGSFTPERLRSVSVPCLVVSGEAESVVDNRSHVRISGQLPNATYRTVPGAKHELLNERDDLRSQFWAHLDAWLEETAGF